MNSQTARRPEKTKNTRPARSRKYAKQTAHVEARRDGTPLIFGWGGHLSRTEKTRLQRRAIWVLAALIALTIVGTVVFSWVNINVIIPNHTITSVNGENIPLANFRKMAALQAQMRLNSINNLTKQGDSLTKQSSDLQKTIDSTNKQIDDLNKQIKALPADQKDQHDALTKQVTDAQAKVKDTQTKKDTLDVQSNDILQNQIPNAKQLYTQSQVANDSSDWLQQDAMIRQWEANQGANVRTQIDPTPNTITQAFNAFKADTASSNGGYSQFLSSDNVSDQDIHDMITIKVRRDNMQKYLAGQYTTPAYQVQARGITLDTQADAQKALDRLHKGEDFAKVAKDMSKDVNTNTKGGDFGWLVNGQYSLDYAQKVGGVVDNWLFASQRKVNELSPIISDAGAFHIVQITGIQQSRAVDSAKLQSLKGSALDLWLVKQKALLGSKITATDIDTILDASNLPSSVPVSPPAQQNQNGSGTGLPSGLPGQDPTSGQ
ncbi:peptidylprolyl isomerase [Ktedonobacter robiniae]|uniref:PpiC domain-containing protein n=1 Tax=Ktedonobacter robiniae TaxID=2778365 RepID=A0ABQ3ULY3_9CHLR|nr:peptidylprolyl isomerase [Ktedonobacter robiniae]GHO53690.1 hypothetical protein KSB_21650 [Ktedonobacter robiniae]